MCRLFGLHAGARPAAATFWLLDAPDSLAAQSHRNPDGAGIGTFDDNDRPVIDKQPMAAWDDADFASGARDLHSRTFVAHVRYASTGAHTLENTHPFEQDGRLFAHNGAFEGLADLDKRLHELGVTDLVHGETDSERMFALITAETRSTGDLQQGIAAAISWIAGNLPVYALNFVLTTPADLWAFRYPETNELHLLRTNEDEAERFEHRTDRIHAQSDELAGQPCVTIASEVMDDESAWQPIDPGTLVHVDAALNIATTSIRTAPPAQPLTRADLEANS
jgi:glutamine amidotransferase